ncbi:MAG: GntR family transcriptional regulator [Pseudonocardiaceae bacterium]|nr:GntR family transcriptional regulator [Pseudonocardiaceae bacterium]
MRRALPSLAFRGMGRGMSGRTRHPMPPSKRRPRGYIEELPSGSHRAVVYAGTDPLTGKPRYVRETAKSYDAAEKALTKLQRHVDEDQHPKTAITVRKAVAAGVDLRTVAGRLGHGSGGATTLKVYAAWVDEADRRAADTIASVMPRPVPVQALRGPYEQIAEAIRADIRTGRLQPGDQLPTVAEIAVANTAAVGTAHRAMALLNGEGVIEVTHGHRVVVSAKASADSPLRGTNVATEPLIA